MKQRKILNSMLLCSIALVPLIANSCSFSSLLSNKLKDSYNNQTKKPNSETENGSNSSDSSSSGSNNSNSSSDGNNSDIVFNTNELSSKRFREMPKFDIARDQKGFYRLWLYIKQIPQNVKEELGEINSLNKNLLNQKLIEKYNEVKEKIGTNSASQDINRKDFGDSLFGQINNAKYSDKSIFGNRGLEQLNYYWNQADQRLFNLEKPENKRWEWKINEDSSLISSTNELEIFLMTPYHLLAYSEKQLELMKTYINYQIALYTSFSNRNKSFEEQLKFDHLKLDKEIKTLESALTQAEKLATHINIFLNPITHYSKDKNTVFSPLPELGDKEMYKELLDLMNKEIAPLLIKYGDYDSSPLEDIGNKTLIKKYFYPLLEGRELKIDYSEEEIKKLIKDFKINGRVKYNFEYDFTEDV
ncbi:hypothetical protein [Mesomycoplasma molare]|uniref:Lipoprotein n=1 Tax=Mesomycoplasma molare TaxID=171288 RepID=A0ABY5TV10_9BACT|nr:hypothetical protein [Mesomycoplasma molare]UWD34487.1 hypothetical protein NX772_01495 [Mesomycoplasma molare]